MDLVGDVADPQDDPAFGEIARRVHHRHLERAPAIVGSPAAQVDGLAELGFGPGALHDGETAGMSSG